MAAPPSVSAPDDSRPAGPGLASPRLRLAGWGNQPVEECEVFRPESRADVRAVVTCAPQRNLIARGLGRSYGDPALNADGAVLLGTRLDRLLEFDPETAVLHAEAAVSLAELAELFLPRGFFFPVTPGTKFVTLGGAIAADVHGKNHHASGSMSNHLIEFSLMLANGDVVRCSREEQSDLFWATVGGMGLTGIILDARIRLRPIASGYLQVDHEQAPDLDAVLARMAESDRDYDYSVAWIDCIASGRSMGRSVLFRAREGAIEDLPPGQRAAPWSVPTRRFRPGVPFTLPDFTLNSLTMRAFNSAFYRFHPTRSFLQDYMSFLYPLDTVHHWNRVYGRRGVLQYQCSLPGATSREALIEILERMSRARAGSFLAVLKSFGPGSEGLLSFPSPGHTLSLDVPYSGAGIVTLLHELDAVVIRHGGRVYLAKDACLLPEMVAEMYPGLPAFRAVKARVDPEQRFSSSQARRLRLLEDA